MAGIRSHYLKQVVALACGVALLAGPVCTAGQEPPDLREQVQKLQRQNDALQQQLQQQQQVITALDRRLTELQATTKMQAAATAAASLPDQPERSGLSFGKTQLSGEAGMAFFQSGSEGQHPHGEFRVDEAKLFVDTQIFKNVFFFTELNITQREEPYEYLRVGEIYLDFEDLSRLWGKDRQLNLRAGRMDCPFGEEYLVRDAIDNREAVAVKNAPDVRWVCRYDR